MNNQQPRWILYQTVTKLVGKGVTFGDPLLAPAAVQPSKYSLNFDYWPGGPAAAVDNGFGIIANRSLDHVAIGRKLEGVDNPQALLQELTGKLKIGGYLVLAVGTEPSRPEQHQFSEASLTEMVKQSGRWQAKDSIVRDGWIVQTYKRIDGTRGIEQATRDNVPRACVIRYGALGDMIILTPLLRQLKADGYHVTLNATPYCLPAAQNNPHIDNVLIQEREAIPNLELGAYWNYWRPQYDRYINLSESLEGGLLKVEGRRDFYTHADWRRSVCNVNYYDRTMAIGGYPETTGTRGELYFSSSEERNAKRFFEPLKDKFVIVWALNGSSHHKAYPLMESVMRDWLSQHPDGRLITVGDHMAQLLEFDHPQVIRQAGQWPIRQSLIATKYANLVVGPETVMTNAAGCFDTPKITLLSHSTHENLCKYWTNDYCLTPDRAEAPCYPCHQLHYTRESCPLRTLVDDRNGQELATGPACIMNAISGQRLIDRLNEVYSKHHA